jgi:ATP-binding cassette subfamily B protein
MSLGFIVGILQRGRASYARGAEILRAEPDIVDGPVRPAQLPTGLEVSGLRFSYEQRQVLADVSFELEPGKSLAIVGRTGAGKSTLALLLARLLPTPAGSVFLGGHDVCDLPLATVRRVVGYAQQNAFLFSTTVGRNIAFCLDEPMRCVTCPMASIPWSVSAACSFRAARSSAWRWRRRSSPSRKS